MTRSALTVSILLTAISLVAAAPDGPSTVTRVFDLGAFVSGLADRPVGRLGIAGSDGFDAETWRDGPPEFLTVEVVAEIVRAEMVSAGLAAGIEISSDGPWLEASGTPEALDRAGTVVADLWNEAARRIRVDVEHVSLDGDATTGLAETGHLDELLAGRLDAAGRAAVLAAGRRTGKPLTGTVVVPPGRRGTIHQVSSTSYVRDYSVEIAQGSAVGDPIVDRIREGFLLDVRPHALSDGRFLLEVLDRRALRDRPIRHLHLEAEFLGSVDLPSVARERTFGAGRVRPGETMVLVAGSAGRLRATLLTPRWTTPPARSRFAPTTALLRPAAGYVLGDEDDGDEDLDPIAPPVLRYLGSSSAPDDDSSLLPPADDAVTVHLRRLENLRLKTWRVHLRVIRHEDDGPVETFAAHLDTTPGRHVTFESGVERAYVADWEVEVAQESRVGDPVIRLAHGGFAASLRVSSTPLAGTVLVEADLLLARLEDEFETRRTGNATTGVVEIPDVARVRLARSLALAIGEIHVIEVGGTGPRTTIEIRLEGER